MFYFNYTLFSPRFKDESNIECAVRKVFEGFILSVMPQHTADITDADLSHLDFANNYK